MTALFVAGEGPHEIGKWAEVPERRSSSSRGDGVLAALFRKVHSDRAQVIGGRKWSLAPLYKAGGHATADVRRLRQLAHLASEQGADALLWSRDLDNIEVREDELLEGQKTIQKTIRQDHDALLLVGGVAIRCLEAWIIGIGKLHQKPEPLSVPKAVQLTRSGAVDTEAQMVALVDRSPLDTSSTPSLARWLDLARSVPCAGPVFGP